MKKTKYYVSMIDRFMSGWGPARDRKNLLLFVCDTKEEAETVEINARKRNDMTRINNLGTFKPLYFKENETDYESGEYFIQIKTIRDYPTWYKRNAF